jgi:hypothetical protein
VWLKLKIETKMRKGKYVSKIKTVIIKVRICSNIVGTLYHLKGSLFKINPKTANDKKKN